LSRAGCWVMTTASAPTRLAGWLAGGLRAGSPTCPTRARSRSPCSHPARRGGRRCPHAHGRRRAAAPPSGSASRCTPCRGGGGGGASSSTACQAPTLTQATSWVNPSQSSSVSGRLQQTDGNACSCRTGASRLESSAKRRTAAPQTAGGGTGTRCTTWGPVAGGTRRPPPSPHV
jgi:hypothetical protein